MGLFLKNLLSSEQIESIQIWKTFKIKKKDIIFINKLIKNLLIRQYEFGLHLSRVISKPEGYFDSF